jgi:hypothetical protein
MSSDTILVAQKSHDRPNTTRAPEKKGQTLGNIGKSQLMTRVIPVYTSYKCLINEITPFIVYV